MVQALIELNEDANRVLNIVKAKYGLHDKGEAVEFIIEKYVEYENEPELRPDFIERMSRIRKEKALKVDDPSARYGLDV